MLEQFDYLTIIQQVTEPNTLTSEHHLSKNIKKIEKSSSNFLFTKNTTNVIFSNHQKKLVWDKANVDNEVNQELDQSKNQQEGC